MNQLTFTEKQDILLLLSEQIARLNKLLSKLPKNSKKISNHDAKQNYTTLIVRYNQTWQKINTNF